jgi:hypothetical protein
VFVLKSRPLPSLPQMVFGNVEDARKPFLAALFAIISLSTATFVYLAVDGSDSIDKCTRSDAGNRTAANGSHAWSTTTTALAPTLTRAQVAAAVVVADGGAADNATTRLATATASTTPAPEHHKTIHVAKYKDAVTGGIAICAMLTATAIAVVLTVYCRTPNLLRLAFGLFGVLIVALLYPMIVFSQALSDNEHCESVGLRLVPSTVGLFVVGLSTALFISDTLGKIRSGDEGPSARPLVT